MSDLTGPRFEPQTFCSRDKRVTAQPTNYRNYLVTTMATVFHSNFKSKKPYVFVNLLLFLAVDICQQVFQLR